MLVFRTTPGRSFKQTHRARVKQPNSTNPFQDASSKSPIPPIPHSRLDSLHAFTNSPRLSHISDLNSHTFNLLSISSLTKYEETADASLFLLPRWPRRNVQQSPPSLPNPPTHRRRNHLPRPDRNPSLLSPLATTISINAAPGPAPLIYDFSGFPLHYYSATYPNTGSPQLASRVCSLLSASNDSNISCVPTTDRGLDHGVWAGFHVAFNPSSNPLNVPLVQASLFRSEDPDAHYRLGAALSALRDEGVVIIGAGMSVHNLYHMSNDPRPMPYAVSFDDALKEAVEVANVAERQDKMAQVCRRPDAKQAHPYMDHLMPIHVAAGAAGDDRGKQLWTMKEGSFAWAQYRFGDVPKSVA
ncbi:hypothetical protein HER10_EVM0004041 [Colletotrichum scovillei]|uniref:uncharacterized protein n=1 Tax=Colletotrichum scovillei TaxID=1209932 RepID=UPI0015C3BE76|nr:uncharacterized protein HER10_EVM0004041 [Colletotrichum scovillei]KAF4779450.1 hypothetical protein HER10_EVM0004041 [Colletotrichum scovillei]